MSEKGGVLGRESVLVEENGCIFEDEVAIFEKEVVVALALTNMDSSACECKMYV